MVTLTLQFLIVALLPLSFVAMLIYIWRHASGRRSLRFAWTLTLIAAGVWSSSILRHYGGTSFPVSVVFTWRVIGTYALSVAALGMLWTTQRHLSVLRHYRWVLFLPGVLLTLGALSLDTEVWRTTLPRLMLGGQAVRPFDLWAAMWVASWLIPTIAAFMLTRQANSQLPHSLYRNQIQYWLIVLSLFLGGAALGSIQDPGRIGWQQSGNLLAALAAAIGTVSLTHPQLPSLPLAIRQLVSRLSGAAVIFGLALLALGLAAGLANVPTGISPFIVLLLAAGVFTAVLTLALRLTTRLTRRLLLPKAAQFENLLAGQENILGSLPEPKQVAGLFLHLVQRQLLANEAWFFIAEEAVGGRLGLRPLATLDVETDLNVATFRHDSPFTIYLRREKRPLAQYDIAALPQFDALDDEEQLQLVLWDRALYIPVHLGNELIAVAALGNKQTGEAYGAQDFHYLESLASQVAPLLTQAQNALSLQQLNRYVFQQNQNLVHEKQRLQALVDLYEQFIGLVSPALRQPFSQIGRELQQLQERLHQYPNPPSLEKIGHEIDGVKSAVDKLVVASSRLKQNDDFRFKDVWLDSVIKASLRSLATMAKARRVTIDFTPPVIVPKVYGDEQQLQQALYHLLHNAIKFNRIDGMVHVILGMDEQEATIEVRDEGVGLPEDRLEKLWQGLDSSEVFPNGNYRSRRPRLGLGLILAHYIVTAHGGHIDARSTYGTGSTFTIYLPLAGEE